MTALPQRQSTPHVSTYASLKPESDPTLLKLVIDRLQDWHLRPPARLPDASISALPDVIGLTDGTWWAEVTGQQSIPEDPR